MNPDAAKQIAAKWAHDLLKRPDKFCVLDTETTGLGNDDEICDIAIVSGTGANLLNRYVSPTVPITPEAWAIHKISNEMVQLSSSFDEMLICVLQAVGTRDVVIFNAEFDLRLIRQSLKPYGIQLAFPTSDRRQCRIFPNGGSIHCAMGWYSQWVGDWSLEHGNYKWQKLPGEDHTAIGDCRATLDLIHLIADSYQPQDPFSEEAIQQASRTS